MLFSKKKKRAENIKEVLSEIERMIKKMEEIEERLRELKKRSDFFISRVKTIRYNPFSDLGGNQSFSVIFLDDNNSGVVITSLFSNGGSQVYAKPIRQGKSEYALSEEEKKLLKDALKK